MAKALSMVLVAVLASASVADAQNYLDAGVDQDAGEGRPVPHRARRRTLQRHRPERRD